jgi:hypothetical protein
MKKFCQMSNLQSNGLIRLHLQFHERLAMGFYLHVLGTLLTTVRLDAA